MHVRRMRLRAVARRAEQYGACHRLSEVPHGNSPLNGDVTNSAMAMPRYEAKHS
jgi:hypothetical protein